MDNGVLFFSMMAFVPAFFFASVYAQVVPRVRHKPAGLYLLIFFAGFAPAAQIGGRMLDRGGAKRPMVLGSALACRVSPCGQGRCCTCTWAPSGPTS